MVSDVERPRGDPLYRAVIMSAIGLTALLVTSALLRHVTPVLAAVPSFVMMSHGFIMLAAACVGYLALGRHRVLHDPVSYWVATAFAVYGVFTLFYALVWPGMLPDGQSLIARTPNLASWVFILSQLALAALLLVGVTASLRGALPPQPHVTRNLLAWLGLTATLCLILLSIETRLPVMVTDARFTPLALTVTWTTAIFMTLLGVLFTLAYRRRRDPLLAHVAIMVMIFAVADVMSVIALERYSLQWYLSRAGLIGGTLTVLFGLLGEYVALYRREQTARKEAEARAAELDAVINTISDGVIIYDLDAKPVRMNPATMAAMGFTEEDLQLPIEERVATLDLPPVEARRYVDAVRNGEATSGMVVNLWQGDPRERTLVGSTAPLRNSDDETIGSVTTFTDVTSLLAAQREAQQRAEELETIINSIADAVAVYDAQGQMVRGNPALRKLISFTEDEAALPVPERMRLASPLDERGRPIDEARYAVTRALRGETLSSYPTTMFPGSDREVHALFSGAPLRGADGEITGAVVTATDVTAMRRTEEALRQTAEHLEVAARAARFGAFDADLVTGDFYWSPEMRAIIGVGPDVPTPSALIQSDYLYPEDAGRVAEMKRAAYDPAGDGIITGENRIVRPDGEVRWIQWRGQVEFSGEGAERRPVRATGIILDVTDRKQAEAERERLLAQVQRQAAQLNATFRSIHEGLIVCDSAGNLISANPAASEMLGYSRMEEASSRIQDFSLRAEYPDGRDVPVSEWPLSRALRGETVPRLELWITREDQGWRRLWSFSFAPIRDDSGTVILAMSTIRDITDERRNEEELRRHRDELETLVRDRTQTIRQLAAELALAEHRERQRLATRLHDNVSQSLAFAKMQLGAVRTATSRELADQAAAEVASVLNDTIAHTRDLTNELSAPRLYDHGLADAVAWMASTSSHRHRRAVGVRILGTPARLPEDTEVTVYQGTKELLNNALKYAGESPVAIAVDFQPDQLRVEVADQGCGFDPTAAPRIEGGGGFGLPNIRERLAYVGGRLSIESAPGTGTRCTIVVPINGAASAAQE